jgi:RNA polymerase subunit RPABC4/transcription elongation factor Spt4
MNEACEVSCKNCKYSSDETICKNCGYDNGPRKNDD